ncbi:MAG: hypothetical protein GTO18_19860 [Anaerolineales bacterium]|nr:hypothetical protein [Anaerolineales bacterium]
MMHIGWSKLLKLILSVIVLLGLFLPPIQISSYGATSDQAVQDNVRLGFHDQTGKVSFIGADPSSPFQIDGVSMKDFSQPDQAMIYLSYFAELIGLNNPSRELVVLSENQADEDGRGSLRYQQYYKGIPVLAGEIIVNLDSMGNLLSISGEISPDPSLSTIPTLNREEAIEIAKGSLAKGYGVESSEFTATEPELWIYDERLLKTSSRPVELVWRLDVTSHHPFPIEELVLVNAQSGGVSLHFNQIDTSWRMPKNNSDTPQSTSSEILLEVQAYTHGSTPRYSWTHRDTPTNPNWNNSHEATSENPISAQNSFTKDFPRFMANGTTWYVSTTGDDTNDCLSSTTECASVNGVLSKPGFIAGDSILVGSGTYTGSGSEVVLFNLGASLSGGWNVDFSSQGGSSIIDGEGSRRGMTVTSGSLVNVENFSVINGSSSATGGIWNQGTLTLQRSTISENTGTSSGGIYNSGTLSLDQSTVQDNVSIQGGGGISNGGVLTLMDSSVENNMAHHAGGGINGNGTVNINNSTVSGNTSYQEGGGIYVWDNGTVVFSINNSTITNNKASQGGGIYVSGGPPFVTATLQNSILAGNFSVPTPDCRGNLGSLGYNIIGDTTGCTFTATTGDQTDTQAGIGYLLGSPGYHPLSSTSLGVNGGNPSGCVDHAGSPLSTDQRGVARVGTCDIGAYEYTTPGTPDRVLAFSGTPQSSPPLVEFRNPLQAAVLDSAGSPVEGTSVNFSAPGSGASGTFTESGTNSTTVLTNEFGIATTSAFTANGIEGTYVATGSVGGVPPTADFNLENRGWYVSTSGSDTNDCTSPATTCATIGGVLSKPGFTPSDTILVSSGTYTGSASQVVLLEEDVFILGGWDDTFSSQNGSSIIDGEDTRRGIRVDNGARVTLENFTLQNGNSSYGGGGQLTNGELTLNNSTITNNTASDAGGGLANGTWEMEGSKTLTLNNCTIDGNTVTGHNGVGAGLYNGQSANLIINASTISNNTIIANYEYGGGIYHSPSTSSVILNNSTISGNSAAGEGGGIFSRYGSFLIKNSTVTNNSTDGYGGGISSSGSVTLQNSIIAGNSSPAFGPDCFARNDPGPTNHISNGYTLIGDDTSCKLTAGPGDLINIDPLLGPLQINGGPTLTHALLVGSPAMDSGNPSAPGSGGTSCELADQRGIVRPVDGDENGSSLCDIGAYEYTPPGVPESILIVGGSPQTAAPLSTFPELLEALVFDNFGSPLAGVTVTFTAPLSGASGTFTDSGTNETTAITGSNGIAVASPFTANGIEGSYSVSATAPGVSTPKYFELTNFGPIPDAIVMFEGSPQYSEPLATFSDSLKALVLDNYGDPLPGVTVTFTAPSSGASGTFSDTASYETTAVTDSNGIAQTSDFTANTEMGSYTVLASVPGVASPAEFSLVNSAAWYVSTSGDDTNDCQSPGTACASINGVFAKPTFNDDDIVRVGTGTYLGAGSEVVLIDHSAMVSGGWDSGFSAQTGTSVIDAENARRGIQVEVGLTVLMERFTVQNGGTTGYGDGINNAGNLSLNRFIIRDNKTMTTGFGGGVYNSSTGTLNLNDSAVFNNGNPELCVGSAIYSQGVLNISNSTISGNVATRIYCAGPALISSGTASLKNTTVTNNYPIGIYRSSGADAFTIQNSIISENFDDCGNSLSIDSLGYNLVGKPECTIFSTTGDLIGTTLDPIHAYLGQLQDNGGGTFTHAPARTPYFVSPAIDAGNPAVPGSGGSSCEANDQRGISRPLDGDENGTPICDMGSLELDPSDPPGPFSWYVSESGNDANSCFSPTTPCASINGALAKPWVGEGDTIKIMGGTYTDTGSEVILLDKSVNLSGGWDVTFTRQNDTTYIDGQELRRGITIPVGLTSVIDHVIVQNAYSALDGGGILNQGNLTLNYSQVLNNMSDGNSGGIRNEGTLSLNSTSVWGNTSNSSAGGIYNSGSLTLQNSTVYTNSAGCAYGNRGGGGISNDGGTALLSNSTISGNLSTCGYGGGIDNRGDLTLLNNTISGNHAPYGSGGGIYTSSTTTLQNSILAWNRSGSGPDCSGSLTSNGYNLIGDSTGCTFISATGDVVGTSASPVDPTLEWLQDNGGASYTHALLEGSPAIDSGCPLAPGSGGTACEMNDQRGVTRPVDAFCDMGSFEGSVVGEPYNFLLTYTANNDVDIPGTLLCSTSLQCTEGKDLHADAAHQYANDFHNYFAQHHGRDSIDNFGMTITSTVHYDSWYYNAYWSSSSQQVIYGDGNGYPLADDVVGHELTHGVTDYESNLFYYYQSGAINESFSDMWGEFIDLTNASGDDSPAVKWLIGEDVSGSGAARDMEDPTTFNHPDKMTSPNYYIGSADVGYFGDNGGVHTNSGVNNKAAYLLSEGGTFNSYTIIGLGIDKVASLYYEVQTRLLTSGSDYGDLYNALYQGCLNLVGGVDGITSSDCNEVRNATNAVEMNLEPVPGYNPHAEYCPAGGLPIALFHDDFESGTDNWSFSSGNWGRATGYATSGEYLLWGDDAAAYSDTNASMILDISLPLGEQSFLHFNHAFGLEDPDYDGAWLEYSTNGGGTWFDAEPLFGDGLTYTGTINTLTGFGDNPHTGRNAFVGDSHGYVSTRYDLSSLAGANVRFRWRMSTDSIYYDWGWFLDDINIYICGEHFVFLPLITK